MGGGGSGAFPPPPGPFVLTTATAGGWTQIPSPKATYYNGKTYFGYVNGANGNVEIRTYTHSSGIVSAATVLHAALGADTHEAPAIILRTSDRRVLAAYSAHNGNDLFVWISTNPEDISAGAETNIDGPVGSGMYTYANLVQLSGESGAIYLFFRNNSGGIAYWQRTKSTDGGATWATYNEVYSNGTFAYWKVTSDGVNRIDFAVTDQSVPGSGNTKVGHFYYSGGGYFKSDGTSIGTTPPLTFADVTLVVDPSKPVWMTDIALDGSNNPRVVYNTDNGSSTDSSFGYGRWTGSAWTNSTILASVGFGIVDPSPVACLDAAVLTQCHLVRYMGGHFELWRYTTGDGGATWSGVSLTPSPGNDNIYPTSVKGGHPSDLAVLWTDGTYTSSSSNSLGVKGIAQ